VRRINDVEATGREDGCDARDPTRGGRRRGLIPARGREPADAVGVGTPAIGAARSERRATGIVRDTIWGCCCPPADARSWLPHAQRTDPSIRLLLRRAGARSADGLERPRKDRAMAGHADSSTLNVQPRQRRMVYEALAKEPSGCSVKELLRNGDIAESDLRETLRKLDSAGLAQRIKGTWCAIPLQGAEPASTSGREAGVGDTLDTA
jgi:hypothetical protein